MVYAPLTLILLLNFRTLIMINVKSFLFIFYSFIIGVFIVIGLFSCWVAYSILGILIKIEIMNIYAEFVGDAYGSWVLLKRCSCGTVYDSGTQTIIVYPEK